MIIINIAETILIIPEILSYFVTGFIFLKTLGFFISKKQFETPAFLVWCIVISYIIKNIIGALSLNDWISLLVSILFSVILATISSFIYNAKFVNQLITRFTKKSIHDDIWRTVIDYDCGTTFNIFLKNDNVKYTGILVAHEEKGNESWFVFTDYISEYADGSTFTSSECGYPTYVAINLSEISRMELFYNKDSKIIK